MEPIDNSNYEIWLLRYAEQELDDSERQAVEQWLAHHPDAAEELALYSEAPRMEKDEMVHYGAAVPQRTLPLWPAVLHWTAAAAVVVALMVLVVRMATVEAPRLADNAIALALQESAPEEIKEEMVAEKPVVRNAAPVKVVEPEPVMYAEELPAQQEEEVETLPVVEEMPQPSVVYSDNLIVYDQTPDTVYTDALIAYDKTRPTWREMLRERWEESRINRNLRRHANEFYAMADNRFGNRE